MAATFQSMFATIERHRARALAEHVDYGTIRPATPPPGLHVERGLEPQARLLGGLARRHPEIAAIFAHGLVTSLIHSPYPKDPHDPWVAAYDPREHCIVVQHPQHCTATTLVHELGHAAQSYFAATGIDLTRPEWHADQPAASLYGSGANAQEKWAEAWTASLSSQEQAFRRHAPQQAAAVAKVRAHLRGPAARGRRRGR